MFVRHRSKHIRDPASLVAFEQERRDEDSPQARQRSEDRATAFLRNTFGPLEFPPEIAMRVLTHASYRGGRYGHNTRLSFVGRRVLHAYLRLFVLSASIPNESSTPTDAMRFPFQLPFDDVDTFCDDLLNTYRLGEHVGGVWQVENVMRWTPALVDHDEPGKLLRSSGLFKVRGTTVEAVMGGIFHQYGGAVALRAFHTRVLPHLEIFLKEPLRTHARQKRDEMGGTMGALVLSGEGDAYQQPPPPVRRRAEHQHSTQAPPPFEARQKLRAAAAA
ncbi:hypothetical protein AURDEDRAFT_89056 [Auricularia subglabra TFB-10046 SS5]|nr:hypothetical protein AURDEDRAFT_89056 [Auricularia subglabra TFB-10046 SS5]